MYVDTVNSPLLQSQAMVMQPYISRILDTIHNVGSSFVLAHHHCACNKHKNIRIRSKY